MHKKREIRLLVSTIRLFLFGKKSDSDRDVFFKRYARIVHENFSIFYSYGRFLFTDWTQQLRVNLGCIQTGAV